MFPTQGISWPEHRLLPVNPVSPIDVPDLREIASASIAIAIWNHINIPAALIQANPNSLHPSRFLHNIINIGVEVQQYSFTWEQVILKVCELSEKLPVPSSVVEYIKKTVDKVGCRMVKWVTYHHRTVFFKNGTGVNLFYHIPYFAWYSDGSINHEQTARNLLSSLRLSFVEKYRLLCTYCLKDEIEEVIPMLFSDSVQEIVQFSSYPMIYYWNCYFRNKLSCIPVTENRSLDSFMIQHTAVDNWPAKKYFFNRLSSEEKIRNAIYLIDNQSKLYQRLIFTKLSEFERMHVYMQRAEKIVTNYMDIDCRHILPAWFEMRFLITAEQFSSLFYTLLKSCHHPISHHPILHLNFRAHVPIQNGNLQRILKEIWRNAGVDFRNHLIAYNDCEIINKIFELSIKNNDTNDLLFTILSNVDAYHKKKIINLPFFGSHCDRLLSSDDFQEFNRLLNVFLPAAVEHNSVKFREDVVFRSAYVRKQCSIYYSKGNVHLVNELLSKLLPTTHSDVIGEFKKNLLLSSEGIGQCVDYGILYLSEYTMNAVMADSLQLNEFIAEFKRKLVISSSAVKVFQAWILNFGDITNVQYFIDNYLISDEDKKTLKRRLLAFDDPVSYIIGLFSKYDHESIQKLFEWCLEDEMREFKSTLPVDDIFNELLKRAIFSRYDRHLTNCVFKPPGAFNYEIGLLNRFLNWYFDSYDEIKEYKLRRINSYSNELIVIKTLLRKKDHNFLQTTLAWFFDNDQEEKQKFRNTQKGRIRYLPF